MNDRCNRGIGEYMASGNRKENPWGNKVIGFSEFGVIQGLSVSQDWVLVKVRLRATLGVTLEGTRERMENAPERRINVGEHTREIALKAETDRTSKRMAELTGK